jgi:hypothetical protein
MDSQHIGKREAALAMLIRALIPAVLLDLVGIGRIVLYQAEDTLISVGILGTSFLVLIGSYLYGYFSKKARHAALLDIIDSNERVLEILNSYPAVITSTFEDFVREVHILDVVSVRNEMRDEMLKGVEEMGARVAELRKKRKRYPELYAQALKLANSAADHAEKGMAAIADVDLIPKLTEEEVQKMCGENFWKERYERYVIFRQSDVGEYEKTKAGLDAQKENLLKEISLAWETIKQIS